MRDAALEAIIAHDAAAGLPGFTPADHGEVDHGWDGIARRLARRATTARKRFIETSLLVGTNRFVTLHADPSGRWSKGETGFMVENDYPEKYDVMLLLLTGAYYFYAEEVRYVGLTDEARVAKVRAALDANPDAAALLLNDASKPDGSRP